MGSWNEINLSLFLLLHKKHLENPVTPKNVFVKEMMFAFWWGVDTKVFVMHCSWIYVGFILGALGFVHFVFSPCSPYSQYLQIPKMFMMPLWISLLWVHVTIMGFFFFLHMDWNKTQKIIQFSCQSQLLRIIELSIKVTLSLWASFHPPPPIPTFSGIHPQSKKTL